MNRAEVCSFTGHRPEKLPWGNLESDLRCVLFREHLAEAVQDAYRRGYRHFITGMARGADLLFCEAALTLRENHPGVTVEAAIPFSEQPGRWSQADRARYYALLSRCDYETVVQHRYSPGCMQRRNRYLVDRASLLVAAYNGKGGGTLYTLTYALGEDVEVVVIDV
jgi:uncharacterized phage-like protein YoqJ